MCWADSVFDSVGFILVALCWGATNPFIKRGTAGLEHVKASKPSLQPFAEAWYLATRWQYILPLLLNLSGSMVYYYTLSKADLSLAVPITNSMTMLFTTLAGAALGEPVGGPKKWLGMAMVVAGVSICILSRS
ncbi:hypothetical protein GQ42DRAFT_166591 [Ramicandelaber brevisporus]|nr:hypothetical protein GQ42DRAFT_166591 [Ramicandelaber brevisporus]